MLSVEFADKKLTLTEDYIFHTVQGEGKFVGVPSIFVRLSACNLRCEWSNGDGTTTKCDTPYSSHEPEKLLKTVKEVFDDVMAIDCKHVVVTGGEPMLQVNVVHLINALEDAGRHVTVETNGTIYRECKASFWSVSPKLATSCPHTSEHFEMHHSKRLNANALADIARRPHQLKFVLSRPSDEIDVRLIVDLIKLANRSYDESNVYLMPQGVSVAQFDSKMEWLVEMAKKNKWNITDRLHIRLWGHKRGV